MCTLLQVEAFCDVDAKKIARGHYIFEDSTVCDGVLTLVVHLEAMYVHVQLGAVQLSYDLPTCVCLQELPKPRVPIVHFSKAKIPFVLCVKWVSCCTSYTCGSLYVCVEK